MLSLDAKEWATLEGGYRVPYDASVPLRKLQSMATRSEEIWEELWSNLYHQGEVGIASYASLPQIFRIYSERGWIDHNLPSFASAVEKARCQGHNPALPDWLYDDYFETLQGIIRYFMGHPNKDFDISYSRALLLLAAAVVKDMGAYDLLDQIAIGDEKRAIELYYESF